MITGELASRAAAAVGGPRRRSWSPRSCGPARPTSVRPGDAALVTGRRRHRRVRRRRVRGVDRAPLRAARAGDRASRCCCAWCPASADGEREDAIEGAVVEHNPCLSGGALEIFLEPVLPAARMVVLGGSPIAAALRAPGRRGGLRGGRGRRRPPATRRSSSPRTAPTRSTRSPTRCAPACPTSRLWPAPGAARRSARRSTSPSSCARSCTRPPASTSARALRPRSPSRSWLRSSPSATPIPAPRRPRGPRSPRCAARWIRCAA